MPVGWDSVTGPSGPELVAGARVPARLEAGASGQLSHSRVAQCVQTSSVWCPAWGVRKALAQMGLYSSVVTYFFL